MNNANDNILAGSRYNSNLEKLIQLFQDIHPNCLESAVKF